VWVPIFVGAEFLLRSSGTTAGYEPDHPAFGEGKKLSKPDSTVFMSGGLSDRIKA
jgi:hypothetical protein